MDSSHPVSCSMLIFPPSSRCVPRYTSLQITVSPPLPRPPTRYITSVEAWFIPGLLDQFGLPKSPLFALKWKASLCWDPIDSQPLLHLQREKDANPPLASVPIFYLPSPILYSPDGSEWFIQPFSPICAFSRALCWPLVVQTVLRPKIPHYFHLSPSKRSEADLPSSAWSCIPLT